MRKMMETGMVFFMAMMVFMTQPVTADAKAKVLNKKMTIDLNMDLAGIRFAPTKLKKYSKVKVSVKNKKVLKAKTIQNGSFIKAEHEWEQIQDVALIRTKACALLDELLEEFPDVEGIGLTGQMHGIVYLDKEGECVSPLYTWQDGRGAQPVFPACAG